MTTVPMRPLARDKDFAEFAGISVGQAAQLRYLGQGPKFVRITGRQVRYRWDDIEAWIAEQTFSRSDQRPPRMEATQGTSPRSGSVKDSSNAALQKSAPRSKPGQNDDCRS